MGLPQFDKYPTPSADVQKKLDLYNTLPEHDGKKGGNKTRSAYLSANPDVTDFFKAASEYGLVKDAQMAVFEGEDLSDKDKKKLDGSSSSSYSSGYGSGSSTPKYSDPYAHVVSAYGGSSTLSKPKVTVSKGKARVSAKAGSKRVTMKISKAKV